MKIIDDQLMNSLAEEAKKSPRLRKNYNFHQSLQDKCHRFLNALEPGTFIPVHHHPDKDEAFVILRGKVRITTYNDEGEIAESCVISQESGRYGVDIPRNVWHGLECLEPSVLLECKAGPFVEHEVDGILETKPTKDIYFAGGCFWGTEHFFKQIEGVAITEVGFANGHTENPTYKEVYTDQTGFAETVFVRFYPDVVSLEFLLEMFFKAIDPTSLNKQGHDEGTRYRTGVYYTDPADLPVIEKVFAEEQKNYEQPLAVEKLPLQNFYTAEEYHQDYLDKNPDGYCHLPLSLFEFARTVRPSSTQSLRRGSNSNMLAAFMLMVVLAAAALTGCTSSQKQTAATVTESNIENSGVTFEVAKNYFFRNDQEIPASPKITTAEEFGKLFGMATTMGDDGKPTKIDFTKQFVLALVLPVTNLATEITPDRLEEKGDTLFYFYNAKVGEAQSYSTQPISLIILDKKYADKTVVMVNEQVKDYYAAVDRCLAEQIAGHYAPGEYSVPVYQEVAVDASDSTDIRIWGDFWVYNYKQEGDTLKCVSGGSHPGLMHVCQTGEYFYVSDFEQVEDGSRFLPSAKRIFGEYFETFQIHHSDGDEHESLRHDALRAFVRDHGLTATMYQDYGWPAKDLDL